MGKMIIYLIYGARTTTYLKPKKKKKNLDIYLTWYTKFNLKRNIDLNIRATTRSVLEEN